MRHRALHLATWILSRLIPEGEREPLVGDLTEEYALRANAASPSAALKWYLQQVCASVPPLLWTRLTRTAWISTLGVALLAYFAVGVVEFTVNWAISRSPETGTYTYNPLALVIMFPTVMLIGYSAERLRRRAAVVLGAMMLLVVTLMMCSSTEPMPGWFRIAYFFVGPAAAFIGSALRSRRAAQS
jgi:hypothetical protein